MRYSCGKEKRRKSVEKHANLNGIDYLEVLDGPEMPIEQRQCTLFVHFINDLTAETIPARENIRIVDGERIRDISISNDPITGDDKKILIVKVNKPGDFSTYTLRLVKKGAENDQPPEGFDPILSAVEFSFKVNCPGDFDCKTEKKCLTEKLQEPLIDYIAKDFTSFRRLMLDRLSMIMPDWKERHPADLGMVLVDMMAYAADHLSYYQDAVATEAYLGTARKRISVRRHVRLLDYIMNDGCNARVWVQVKVNTDQVFLEKGTPLLTQVPGYEKCISKESYETALAQQPLVFETMHEIHLFKSHNTIRFYTWGDEECCLPRGATKAWLCDTWGDRLLLRPGDVLVFEERVNLNTNKETDADLSHRHAVRLTRVHPEAIDDGNIRTPGVMVRDPLFDEAYVEIEWDADDALPFPLCISTVINGESVNDAGVARGNIVLADHGQKIEGYLFCWDDISGKDNEKDDNRLKEFLKKRFGIRWVETAKIEKIDGGRAIKLTSKDNILSLDLNNDKTNIKIRIDDGRTDEIIARTKNHKLNIYDAEDLNEDLKLKFGPLTQQGWVHDKKNNNPVLFDPEASASHVFSYKPGDALPCVELRENSEKWTARRDLLNSSRFARDFVAEMDDGGYANIRLNRLPAVPLKATYRIGNGSAGNIGAKKIVHIVTNESGIESVSNPMPARGGIDPESVEQVRLYAPQAFRTQKRAVSEADYENKVQEDPDVQKAVVTLRWTGSWYTMFINVDRKGGRPVDDDFKNKLRSRLEPLRMAGYDIEIKDSQPVPLDIAMTVCVMPGYSRSNVKKALLETFSSSDLPDGRRGFFHPDNFTFGQPVYLSRVISTAMQVKGVQWVDIDPKNNRFQRWGQPSRGEFDEGRISIGRLEIARLDNDPNRPENGRIEFHMEGGL